MALGIFEALADFEPKIMNETAPEGVSYLALKKGDLLNVSVQYENGWTYGYLVEDPVQKAGFFPTTYVKELVSHSKNKTDGKLLEAEENIEENNENSSENNQNKENNDNISENPQNIQSNSSEEVDPQPSLKRKAPSTWLDFVQPLLNQPNQVFSTPLPKNDLLEGDILNEALIQENPNSIIGYKKIKISSDPTQALRKKPQFLGSGAQAPVLNNEYAMVNFLFILNFINIFLGKLDSG